MAFVRSYVVPEGFPDSVTPSYVPYMTWRALKVQFRTGVQYALSWFKCSMLTFFHCSALFWWSDGGVHHKNLAELCWSLSKQVNPRCRCYQLDPQGKQIMSIKESICSGHLSIEFIWFIWRKITNLLEGFVLYWSSRIDKHKLMNLSSF